MFGASGPHADKAIRRAAALIRALPDTPLTTYWEKTKTMPASTEAERLVKQRIGQDIFRASLEDYWGGRCPITGIGDRALLRAAIRSPGPTAKRTRSAWTSITASCSPRTSTPPSTPR